MRMSRKPILKKRSLLLNGITIKESLRLKLLRSHPINRQANAMIENNNRKTISISEKIIIVIELPFRVYL